MEFQRNIIISFFAEVFKITFITARKRSLGHGDIFAPVCHSVHREGEVPGQVPPGRYTPLAGTPLCQVHPQQVHPLWAGTPPLAGTPPTRYTPLARYIPQAGTPPWAGTPPSQVHPKAGTPGQVHTPGAVHAGRYGQQADGTNPTGMHSCFTEMIE